MLDLTELLQRLCFHKTLDFRVYMGFRLSTMLSLRRTIRINSRGALLRDRAWPDTLTTSSLVTLHFVKGLVPAQKARQPESILWPWWVASLLRLLQAWDEVQLGIRDTEVRPTKSSKILCLTQNSNIRVPSILHLWVRVCRYGHLASTELCIICWQRLAEYKTFETCRVRAPWRWFLVWIKLASTD